MGHLTLADHRSALPEIAPPSRCLDIRECCETDPPPFDFVLPGLKAGTVGALVSPGGAGKSMYALQAAACVCGAPDALASDHGDTDSRPTRGPVLYLSAEDPSDVLHARIRALSLGLAPESKELLCENLIAASLLGTCIDLTQDSWLQQLRVESEGMRLVILDTLRRCHQADENDSSAMAGLLNGLEQVCAETGTTILFLHHASKAGALNGGDGQQASRGSSVLTDNARYQANLIVMSPQEAQDLNVDESCRRSFVRLAAPKVNYSAPIADRWYRRHAGGVLRPAVLGPATRGKGGARGRA